MFGPISGVGLGKREERGLVRTTILRRWGNPKTPRIIPVNAKNPSHDGGAGLQPHPGALEPTMGHAPPLFALQPEAETLAGALCCRDAGANAAANTEPS